MALSKIKEEYKGRLVGFRNTGKLTLPLGQHPYIDELAIIAHQSGNKSLLKYFEYLPPLADLQQQATEQQLTALRQNTSTDNGAPEKEHTESPASAKGTVKASPSTEGSPNGSRKQQK